VWRNILPHVHGWIIFMDESMDEKRMNFILNIGNKGYFCGELNKRNMVEKKYVDFFQKQFDT
jgi:hypothetical protein